MFDVRRSRLMLVRVLVLLALAAMLAPLRASAADSSSANQPGHPRHIMSLPDSSAGSIVLTATNAGWYTKQGYHDPSISNYLVGDCSAAFCGTPDHYRNYFVFDLSSVVGTITGATLIVADPQDIPPLAPYTLYAVQSSISDVEALHTSATNIYHDLGHGTVYGSIVPAVNTGVQTIPLNGAALVAIQRAKAAQQQIAFGGDMPTPRGSGGVIFGNSGDLTQVQLVLTVR